MSLDREMEVNESSQYLLTAPANDDYDLICVGFGPAGLAIAAALYDSYASGSHAHQPLPKVLFIEKQASFAWHSGMLIPGTKMQISFIKDLATVRNPGSRFTFLNYLHSQGRLIDFTNLDTFLPSRHEFADYMKWCASFFDNVVEYNQQVVSVSPSKRGVKVKSFTVQTKDSQNGETYSYSGRNIVLATGGQAVIPKLTPQPHSRIIHSSQYAIKTAQILPDASAPYKVVVLGAGQSATEVFHNLQTKYPNAEVWLVMKQEFLRPSDDSPFINSIFNPEYRDCVYNRSAASRKTHIADSQATNYGVVRLSLIEQIYEHMYEQKRELGADERNWPHRIFGNSRITSAEPREDGRLTITVRNNESNEGLETIDADLIVAATGYERKSHVEMLRSTWDLMPRVGSTDNSVSDEGIAGWKVLTASGERKIAVGRDYRVKFQEGTTEKGCGIWLQGCCEGTHGLSDTLLSVLATRSGEIVQSIFGTVTQPPRQQRYQSRL